MIAAVEPSPPARPLRHPPPVLFLFLELPFGAAVGYLQIAAPFWLRAEGVSLAQIGAISATAFMPHALKVVWVPLLDIGSYRKIWYLAMVSGTAALLAALSLVPDPAHHLVVFTVLVTAAQVTASTSSAALNALIAITTRESDKGRAGGFYMAGNLGGTGLLGALALWLSTHTTPTSGGLLLAAIVIAAGAGAVTIQEPRHVDAAIAQAGSLARALGRHLAAMLRDLWGTVKSYEGFTGLVICLAPVGCGALTNLFSGMAHDFNAPERVVEVVNGLGGGLTGAAGSLAGGWIADRMNRRLAYAVSGGVTALCAVAMFFSPLTPLTYTWGTLAYSFANGIAFATWAGMVLEMVGHTPAVATKYALFTAASNQAISYVTWLDGRASEFRDLGSRGALAFDALITFAGIGLLLTMVLVAGGRRQRGVYPVAERGGPPETP